MTKVKDEEIMKMGISLQDFDDILYDLKVFSEVKRKTASLSLS